MMGREKFGGWAIQGTMWSKHLLSNMVGTVVWHGHVWLHFSHILTVWFKISYTVDVILKPLNCRLLDLLKSEHRTGAVQKHFKVCTPGEFHIAFVFCLTCCHPVLFFFFLCPLAAATGHWGCRGSAEGAGPGANADGQHDPWEGGRVRAPQKPLRATAG